MRAADLQTGEKEPRDLLHGKFGTFSAQKIVFVIFLFNSAQINVCTHNVPAHCSTPPSVVYVHRQVSPI